MSGSDPELTRLLIEELTRHLAVLETRPWDIPRAQRAVHALKGSAGLAGERELSATLERLHRRMKDGEERAFAEAAGLVRTAIARMKEGESPLPLRWPEPPDDLAARPLDPLVRTQYAAEVTDRLARVDEALASAGDPLETVSLLYRQVHTMKGAASAVGDEPMSWFCHGLEERLKSASSTDDARALVQEVAGYRAVLGALFEDADSALRSLRSPAARQRVTSQAPARSSVLPLEDEPPRSFSEGEATVRVSAQSIDRLLDRLSTVDLVRERISTRGDRARDVSRIIRGLRAGLIEALRLIGPPRPWGAPQAALRRIEKAASQLTSLGDEIEGAAGGLRHSSASLKEAVTDAKKQLSAMRQMPVGRIFARLTTAIESEARRMERAVIVRTRGADETIDRRIAEHLIEPCLQLVRNAVAHGIEPPQERKAMGKPQAGTISLVSRKFGSRLAVTIQDDGAGVDITRLRVQCVEAGLVAPDIAEAADDDTLLSLLFWPGFSTRETTDLLAGRGIGLDIARSAIQRLGGAIRLASRPREGFSARIDVPIGGGLTSVVWVLAGGADYALPAANVAGLRALEPGVSRVPPHLAACLEARPTERPRYVAELVLHGDEEKEPEPLVIGVDGVGRIEEVLVRPLAPLVAALGPFAGAIVRGDGSLRLAVDVYALAPRARALGRMPDSRQSDRPSANPRA